VPAAAARGRAGGKAGALAAEGGAKAQEQRRRPGQRRMVINDESD
jgi:hypothetical protein